MNKKYKKYQRTTSDTFLIFHLAYKGLLFITVNTRLASSWVSKDALYLFYLALWILRLQTHDSVSCFMWILGTWTQVFMPVWLAFYPLSHLSRSFWDFRLLDNKVIHYKICHTYVFSDRVLGLEVIRKRDLRTFVTRYLGLPLCVLSWTNEK